jgi:hypothetical protein
VATFKIQAVVLLVVMLLLAVGLLIFFVMGLSRLRREGTLQYGVLAQEHSMEFHKKWVLGEAGPDEKFLTAPEISTLTDFASAYEKIEEVQPIPIQKGPLVASALAMALPMVPVVLTRIPLAEAIKDLFEAMK